MLIQSTLFFLDTEFTGLHGVPELLSLALVPEASDGPTFYAEVTDPDLLDAASVFAQRSVITQFGRVGGAACNYQELGRRLLVFLDLASLDSKPGEMTARADNSGIPRITRIAFNSDIDWTLMESSLRAADPPGFPARRSCFQPCNIYNMPAFAVGERASDAYFEMQELAPYGRHHALCDARALRVAWLAAAGARVTAPSPWAVAG